jgi:soluble P-type ATPase
MSDQNTEATEAKSKLITLLKEKRAVLMVGAGAASLRAFHF